MAYEVAVENECGRKMVQDVARDERNIRWEMPDRVITIFSTGGMWCVSCVSTDYGTDGGEEYEFQTLREREHAKEVAGRLAERSLDEFDGVTVDSNF